MAGAQKNEEPQAVFPSSSCLELVAPCPPYRAQELAPHFMFPQRLILKLQQHGALSAPVRSSGSTDSFQVLPARLEEILRTDFKDVLQETGLKWAAVVSKLRVAVREHSCGSWLSLSSIPGVLGSLGIQVSSQLWDQLCVSQIHVASRCTGGAQDISSSEDEKAFREAASSAAAPDSPARSPATFAMVLVPSNTKAEERSLVLSQPKSYAHYSKETLAMVVAERDAQITALKRENKTLNQKLKRHDAAHENRLALARASVGHLEAACAESAALVIRHKGKGTIRRHLHTNCGYALAIRKNLSNVAADTVGSTLMLDVCPDVVLKAECDTGSALLGAARKFHHDMELMLQATTGEQLEHAVAIHVLRSDATNSSVWHRSKLQSTELRSIYVFATPETCLEPDWYEHTVYPDIQAVEDSSGAGCHGLLSKQLVGCGAPLWSQLLPPVEGGARRRARIYILVSDRGSDIAKFKKLAQVEALECDGNIVLSVDCMFHAGHLVCKSGLALMDLTLKKFDKKYGYFATLAKLTNLWRDKAKAIFQAWANSYGKPSAMNAAVHIPGRCLAGRWGSVSDAEVFLQRANVSMAQVVLRQVLVKRKGGKTGGEHADIDEVSLEEQAAYSDRISRWAREVMQALSDKLFEAAVAIAHMSRSPLDHLFSALKGKGKAQQSRTFTKFVQSTCRDIFDEFNDILLDDVEWSRIAAISQGSIPLENICLLGASQVLHHAAFYHHRVVEPLTRLFQFCLLLCSLICEM